jgi:hypothetical protein
MTFKGDGKRAWGLGGLVAVVLLAAPGARAQEGLQWQLREGDGLINLAYEVPETDDQDLLLTCDTRSHQLSIRYSDDRDRTRDGSRATVTFASEGGRVNLPMRAEVQELGDQIVLEGTAPWSGGLQAVMGGRMLRITLSGQTESIPLAGAREGVAALTRGCGRP